VNGILKTLFGGSSPEPHNRATGGAYTVDARDSVQPLAGFPQSSIGAPTPIVIASEQALFVAFYLEQRDPNWDGTTCKVVTPDTNDEPVAVVRFSGATAHFFGPPNDEAFSGHPLAARGLEAYGAFEVLSSSWVRALERMNSVHPRHRPESFSDCRHFILTFHDTIFECIADSFSIEQPSGSLRSVVSHLAASL
jgi:hypothetical protein